jgi:hypothetical protein
MEGVIRLEVIDLKPSYAVRITACIEKHTCGLKPSCEIMRLVK